MYKWYNFKRGVFLRIFSGISSKLRKTQNIFFIFHRINLKFIRIVKVFFEYNNEDPSVI